MSQIGYTCIWYQLTFESQKLNIHETLRTKKWLLQTMHLSILPIALLKMCFRSHSLRHHSGLILLQSLVNLWWKHWNRNVILVKFSLLTALNVVTCILTTHGAASDANFDKMIPFPFHWFGPTEPCRLCQCTHWGLDKMTDILQTIFADAFSRQKTFVLWLKFN